MIDGNDMQLIGDIKNLNKLIEYTAEGSLEDGMKSSLILNYAARQADLIKDLEDGLFSELEVGRAMACK